MCSSVINITMVNLLNSNLLIFSYYMSVVPCLPSPCFNNGTCITVNATDQQCVCIDSFTGQFCEVKVSTEITIKLKKV